MPNEMILVTGGAGYIGSHMVRKLLDENFKPIIFDNLSTGHQEFIPQNVPFFYGDLQNEEDLKKVFITYHIDAVMHFAGSALVSESMSDPMKYYENNIYSSINLLKIMINADTKKLIFSSTCAIYGEPNIIPIFEEHETRPTNPYGRSKLMIETMLEDFANIYDLSFISLRYFNVAGSHCSGEIGEWHDPETHLIPNILNVATGRIAELEIYGENHQTDDGTCVRDYIHVDDICEAHLVALNKLSEGKYHGAFNLGSGCGYSIRKVINSTKEITGKNIKTRICPPRPGDPARLVASYDKAEQILGWKPRKKLHDILESAWKWSQNSEYFR